MRQLLRFSGCVALVTSLLFVTSTHAGAFGFAQANPASFKILKGALKGGTVNSLTAADGDKLTIHSARKNRKNPQSTKLVKWIAEFDGVQLSSNDSDVADFEWSGDTGGRTVNFFFVDPATGKPVADPFTTADPTSTDDQEILNVGTFRPFVSNGVLKIELVSSSKRGFLQGTDLLSIGYATP